MKVVVSASFLYMTMFIVCCHFILKDISSCIICITSYLGFIDASLLLSYQLKSFIEKRHFMNI